MKEGDRGRMAGPERGAAPGGSDRGGLLSLNALTEPLSVAAETRGAPSSPRGATKRLCKRESQLIARSATRQATDVPKDAARRPDLCFSHVLRI